MSRYQPSETNPFVALRRFAQPRQPEDRCEMCSAPLSENHEHLLEPARRQIVCSCTPCAILFTGRTDGRYRRVPRRVDVLTDFRLSDAEWEALHLPINLAFFFRESPNGRVLAFYPSPAGATESLLSLDAWETLEQENPILLELEPDVEALLVNRVGETREYFRAPIDECYKLVGLIRTHWQGFSGGTEVWTEIGAFFDALRARAAPHGGPANA